MSFGIVISHILLIFCQNNDLVTYLAIIVFVSCLSGWSNLTFLMSELRAPPQSLGTVNAIAFTISCGLQALAPIICTMDGVKPLIASFAIAILTTITTHCLPKPGAYLPKVTNDQEDDAAASEFASHSRHMRKTDKMRTTRKRSVRKAYDLKKTQAEILNEF